MKFEPYKPNQGRYARFSVAGALAVLFLFAAWRTVRFVGLGESFALIGLNVPYAVLWGALVFFVLSLFALFFVTGYKSGINKFDHTTALFIDLLIDTEGELKKVSWPSKEEIRRYTIVVIASVIFIGGLVYVVDFVVSYAMSGLNVLPV